jgi:hypothetical protein
MLLRHTLAFIVVFAAAGGGRPSADVNVRDTRLLHQPAVGRTARRARSSTPDN